MNLKPTLILLASMLACPFQTQASLTNGGFENGLAGWTGLTEQFGFVEVISSYTDGSGNIFTPTEGSSFVSLWGNNDLVQGFSWATGDQISFDWATASGTNPAVSGASLFAGLFDGLSPIETIITSSSDATTFNTFTHTFTQNSPASGFGILAFQGLGEQAFFGLTNEEVGHVLIDNIQFISASDSAEDPGTEVPEPDTAYLMAMALFLIWGGHNMGKNQQKHY